MHDLDPDYAMSSDPDREAQLHIAAWEGLKAADLTPLSILFRSEFEIEETLRGAIAEAFEGKSPTCRIVAKRTRRGNPGDEEARRLRDGHIAAFVRHRTRKRGEYKRAVHAAEQHFNLKRSTIFEALRRDNAYRKALPPKLETYWDRICSLMMEVSVPNNRSFACSGQQ